MRNYTIFLREPENLLFGYFEYHGDNWAADAAKMAADPKTQILRVVRVSVTLDLMAGTNEIRMNGSSAPRKAVTYN